MGRLLVLALTLCIGMAAMASPSMAQTGGNQRIEQLEFRDSSVGDAIRLIARISGVNIFATRDAASREFSMVVRDTTVRGVISSIARVSGLSFSYDEEARAFILLTNEEFANDIVITRNAQTRVYNLRQQNVVVAAQVIESLFGSRVELTIDTEDPDRLTAPDGDIQTTRSSASNSRFNSNDNNNGRNNNDNSNAWEENFQASDLNPNRLQDLVQASPDGRNIDLSQVASQFGVEPTIYITINREHNLLYVRTSDRQVFRDIERIIRETDRPTKNVLLEMRIMSLTLDDDFRSVFNFGLTDSSLRQNTAVDGSTTTGRVGFDAGQFSRQGGGLFFQYISDNLLAQIELLERNNRAETIATPMLATSNNSPAEIFVGSEATLTRGFSSSSTQNSNQTNTTNTTDVEIREVGQTLEILPRINADDTVTLVIQQENSTVVPDGATLPIVNENGRIQEIDIDTVNTSRVGGTVTTKSGTTIAVGGLIRTQKGRNESKTPVFGNLPLIGNAFRGTTTVDDRQELVLLITPHIYSGGPEGERLARDRLSRLSRNVAIDSEVFANSDSGVPSVKLEGQQQDYVVLTRFAAAMRHGVKPTTRGPYRGIVEAPVSTGGGLKLSQSSSVSVEPVESWKKRNVYVTAVVLTNTSAAPVPINTRNLTGSWLAATAEFDTLSAAGEPGSRGYMYLISDRPFDSIVAALRTGNGI